MSSGIEVKEIKVPVTFDEAEKLDMLSGKYFKPEVNIEYKLTFSEWALYRKKVPNFNNKDLMEEKTVLELTVDSVNGQPVVMEWGIMSQKCRNAFESYCRAGTITKKVFSFKSKGEAKDRVYQVAEIGDKDAITIKA